MDERIIQEKERTRKLYLWLSVLNAKIEFTTPKSRELREFFIAFHENATKWIEPYII